MRAASSLFNVMMFFVASASAIFLADVSWVSAQTGTSEAKAPTPTPLPQSGVLSRSSTFGYNTKIVEGAWGSESDASSKPPITGSISKVSDREWVAKLFNNSEDTYTVSVEVKQMNAAGKRERSDSFSARLGPNENTERTLGATARTVDAELELRNWKNISELKRKSAEKSADATAAQKGATTNSSRVSKN